MPRKCSICAHPNRDSIDREIVEGKSYRDIARRFRVSKDAVYRHAQHHLPERLVKAKEASEAAHADTLLNRIEELTQKAKQLLVFGQTEKQGKAWAAGLRELRKSLELLAKITGELESRPEINIVTHPEYIAMRSKVLEVLRPHPDIRRELAEVLHGNGNN
jgi:phage protein D